MRTCTQDFSNVKEYVNTVWLNKAIASSVEVVRSNLVCATLQSGVTHPSEQTYRELVGLLFWLTADPQSNPSPQAMHDELKTMKAHMALERHRMPPSTLPTYVSLPGAMQFYSRHRAAYDLAWGADSGPPTGVVDLPGGRSLNLLHYLAAGVPLRGSAKTLSVSGGFAARQRPEQQLGLALAQPNLALAQPNQGMDWQAQLGQFLVGLGLLGGDAQGGGAHGGRQDRRFQLRGLAEAWPAAAGAVPLAAPHPEAAAAGAVAEAPAAAGAVAEAPAAAGAVAVAPAVQ